MADGDGILGAVTKAITSAAICCSPTRAKVLRRPDFTWKGQLIPWLPMVLSLFASTHKQTTRYGLRL